MWHGITFMIKNFEALKILNAFYPKTCHKIRQKISPFLSKACWRDQARLHSKSLRYIKIIYIIFSFNIIEMREFQHKMK